MTDSQILTIVLSTVPTMITVLVGILINNSRLNDLRASIDQRFNDFKVYVDARFNAVDARFNAADARSDARFDSVDTRLIGLDRRVDEMKDLARAELHRVEEVLDARLKHLEER